MKMKIAIFAACVGTVALSQVDIARANYAAVSGILGIMQQQDTASSPWLLIACPPGRNCSALSAPKITKVGPGPGRILRHNRSFGGGGG